MARAVLGAALLAAHLGLAAARGPKAEAGKSCFAKSCDADGICEERACTMLDGSAADNTPGTKGRIRSCPG